MMDGGLSYAARACSVIASRFVSRSLAYRVPSGIVEVDHVLVSHPDRPQAHVAGTAK